MVDVNNKAETLRIIRNIQTIIRGVEVIAPVVRPWAEAIIWLTEFAATLEQELEGAPNVPTQAPAPDGVSVGDTQDPSGLPDVPVDPEGR